MIRNYIASVDAEDGVVRIRSESGYTFIIREYDNAEDAQEFAVRLNAILFPPTSVVDYKPDYAWGAGVRAITKKLEAVIYAQSCVNIVFKHDGSYYSVLVVERDNTIVQVYSNGAWRNLIHNKREVIQTWLTSEQEAQTVLTVMQKALLQPARAQR